MLLNKKRIDLKIVAVLAITVGNYPVASAFEVLIEPDDFPEGTDLRTISPFVTMSVATSTSTTPFAVTANEDSADLQSTGSKVFGHANVAFWNDERRLVLDFSSPVSRVSIDANGDFSLDREVGTLEVYDGNGTLLEPFFTPPLSGAHVTMSIIRPQLDIVRAVAYASNGPFLRLDNLVVEFPDQCDFDGDDSCDITDINMLLSEGPVAPGVTVTSGVNDQFDLNGDGVIDNADVDQWLAGAATMAGLGSPFKRGDVNLDGLVDVSDFNQWNANKFTSTLLWDSGNVNGDGVVDVADFNAWNATKFTSSGSVATVPEPGWITLLVPLIVMSLCGARIKGVKESKGSGLIVF